ncbi:MAG: iron-sulfur cluster carrier protein ApbC [Chloroflexi bacterium]|nr:Mrp/NBP35 family ATP-binding protein [Chloroflexota bacterium]MQC26869.1 iron-sulfur cluster carrier protein ApbC [Chloroflexota bacterium]
MADSILSEKQILEALSSVPHPVLKDDLVSLGMVRDVGVKNGAVSFRLVLITPAHPFKSQIEEKAREAVEKLDGVKSLSIEMDAEVPADGRVRAGSAAGVRNIVAIASGKGGVGKSTVAVNVAVVLAERGARVGLLDTDIYGPNIPRMMGVEHLPEPPDKDGRLVPAEAFGVKMMSIGFLVKPEQAMVWRGPMLHNAIRQFIQDVQWGELDYLIVDMPPGTGDVQLSLAQTTPLSGGVIVTLPQSVSVDDARRGIEMFRQLRVPIIGVVENMSYLQNEDGSMVDVFGRGGGEALAKEAQVPFIGQIPLDPAVRIGGDNGKPIVISHPESASAKAFVAIAEDVALKASLAARASQSQAIPIKMVEE